mgnify:FL=1
MRRFAFLTLLLLSGCVTAQDTMTGVQAGPRHRFLTFAGYNSPVLMVSVNAPFHLTPRDVAERLATYAEGSVLGSDVSYTANPGAAKRNNYRIVARFDAEQAATATDACRSAYQSVVAARYADRTNLFMAFCDKGEPIAAAKISGPKLSGPSDPTLREMVRQGMKAMFPDGAGGQAGSMGSIEVTPLPHFRLNPLDGIIN